MQKHLVLETTHRVAAALAAAEVDERVVVVDAQEAGGVARVLRRSPKVGVVAQIEELLVAAVVAASRESGKAVHIRSISPTVRAQI